MDTKVGLLLNIPKDTQKKSRVGKTVFCQKVKCLKRLYSGKTWLAVEYQKCF